MIPSPPHPEGVQGWLSKYRYLSCKDLTPKWTLNSLTFLHLLCLFCFLFFTASHYIVQDNNTGAAVPYLDFHPEPCFLAALTEICGFRGSSAGCFWLKIPVVPPLFCHIHHNKSILLICIAGMHGAKWLQVTFKCEAKMCPHKCTFIHSLFT